jgi:hypothetical protein
MCVSALGAVSVSVFVWLRSSCNHVFSKVGGPLKFERLPPKVVTQNEKYRGRDSAINGSYAVSNGYDFWQSWRNWCCWTNATVCLHSLCNAFWIGHKFVVKYCNTSNNVFPVPRFRTHQLNILRTTNFSSYWVCRLERDSNLALALHHLYDRWIATHLVMGTISDTITFMQNLCKLMTTQEAL